MKSLLMVLFLMVGIAISTVDAQSCKPSSPECAATCKPAASADATKASLPGTAAFAACSPEELAVCQSKMAACEGKKMSKKEMKECQVTCQSKTASAAPAGQTQLVAQPAVGCQPAPAAKNSKQ